MHSRTRRRGIIEKLHIIIQRKAVLRRNVGLRVFGAFSGIGLKDIYIRNGYSE